VNGAGNGDLEAISKVPIDAGVGPVVVLVHGQPGSGADWAAIGRLLSGDHRVIAPDRPGWGTNTSAAVGLAENADALADLLASIGVEGPVTVVGHSFGGAVALEMALRSPQLVGALVLVGSVGVSEALSHLDRLLAVPPVSAWAARAGGGLVRWGLGVASRWPSMYPGARHLGEVTAIPSVASVMGAGHRPAVGRYRRSFVVEEAALVAETPLLEAQLERVAVPVAVVSGASDHIVRPKAARALAGRVKGAELIVLEGGHLLPFERPDLLADVVRRYCAMGLSR